MATTNPTISGGWNLIVNDGDEFLLTLPQASQTVFVAIGGADGSAPAASLLGHPLVSGQDGMSRALLGLGPVYARCVDAAATVILALTTWHSDLLLFDAGVWDTTSTWLTDRMWG